jgi:RimJ/RimL family protein N-acetyltransferase
MACQTKIKIEDDLMNLECEVCVIRSWREGDEESLVHQANNRKIWLNLRDRFPHPYTLADAKWWVQHAKDQNPETDFAIEVDGRAAGGISLILHDDIERCSAEIGYWLGESYWGRGIMTAALKSVTEFAFQEFNLTRVYALPFSRNVSSSNVLEKVGYVLEGVLRRSATKDGEIIDQLMYAKTNSI